MTHAHHHHHHHHGPGHDVPLPGADRPTTGVDELLNLQRTAGNAAVARMVELLRQDGAAGEPPPVQRSTVHDVLRRPGTPLDTGTRTDMEARLGADFSGVRVHTDATAARSAEEIGARAYTSGDHVVIGRGGGDPHTLAHELTHVIQQRQGAVSGTDNGDGLRVSDPSDRFERAAAVVVVVVVVVGRVLRAGGGGEPAVQRTPATWVYHDSVRQALAERNSGWNPLSQWPQISTAVRAYAQLTGADFEGRGRLLADLENAMDRWERNQQSRITPDQNPEQTTRRRQIITGLRTVVQAEVREVDALRRQDAGESLAATPPGTPAPPAPTASTASMAIGIPGSSRAAAQDESSGEGSDSDHDVSMAGLRSRFEGVAALPRGVEVHVHFTKRRRIEPIRQEGLRPGASRGIGLPDTDHQPDNDFIYMLSGSPKAIRFAPADAGGAPVGIISAGTRFGPDRNYTGGGAYQHFGSAPPVRDSATAGGGGPFSFTLPASPNTRQGIADFVNAQIRTSDQQPLSVDEAYQRVLAALWKQMGMTIARDLDQA
ncbi:DUF4157 domain-containing protein [Saccharothrix longispora]|uniref:eCIS core domain-containing protein n=1 Tax=Saccharothrix longispora TaxID=33920 RepID=UPI0028FD739D|nr:DUF4157 domain-containing protein [Saccharothrix longispora]MDU0290348.1 DUF4157 domain-containing protein [Saccharothrix longispora]